MRLSKVLACTVLLAACHPQTTAMAPAALNAVWLGMRDTEVAEEKLAVDKATTKEDAIAGVTVVQTRWHKLWLAWDDFRTGALTYCQLQPKLPAEVKAPPCPL